MEISVLPGGGRKQQNVIVQLGDPVGYQQLAITDSATALTVPGNANLALFVLETAAIRWRDDGTDPTSSVGMFLWQNQNIQFATNKALTQWRGIRTGSTNAKLNISYYKR